MYLRSIEMKGFKSFPEREKLEFSPGVSVIVGPNGSGKSNITDAVLWALGEQSPGAIRGASMQDVISAGGKGVGRRRAAEVEVVIDNSEGRAATEFSEIAIERSLDRSGDGVYRLNGARCRLADVVEVLSDTNLGREMHSVISQGRVEAIIHSKPRDRRMLVEEAAGLGKHRKRRRRAELKLRAAGDNLDRALDLEREARARLRPLKRQAQAAELGAADRKRRARAARPPRRRGAALRRGPRRGGRGGGREGARRAGRGSTRRLAEVSERRRAAEERFAARDRERTQAWGLLTKLRGEQQRIAMRAATLADREAEIEAAAGDAARRARPAHARRRRPAAPRPSGRASSTRSWARSRPASPAPATASPGARSDEPPRPSARRRWATSAAAPSGPPATPAAPRGCSASATARRFASGSPAARSCSTTCAPPPPRRAPRRGRDPRPGRADRGQGRRRRGRRRRDRRGDAGLLEAGVRASGRDEDGLRRADRGRGRGGPARRPPRRGGQGAGGDRRAARRGDRARPSSR